MQKWNKNNVWTKICLSILFKLWLDWLYCEDSGGDSLNCICAWCDRIAHVDVEGCITLHEKNPMDGYMEDEIYHFCTYKCLKRWMDL